MATHPAPTLFVSGGNSGLGKDIALRFARSGYRVFAGTRDLAKAGELLDEASASGLAVEAIELDVDDAASVKRASAEVLAATPRLDLLVNNAGIGVFGVAEELRFDEIQRVMETNFFGAVRLTQAFLPHFRTSRGGAIAFMSSWMGRVPLAGMLTYACSKAALETFAETLAQEVLRFDVRIFILEPGYARTPMHGKAPRYELPEDTPYADLYRNWKAHWRVGYRNPTLPDAVSEALFQAVENADPRIRIVIGDDAQQWIDARERSSDELWREAGQPRELEEFLAWAEQVYGPGLFRG